MVRFTARDINGLVLAGDMYGAPYDLLAAALGVQGGPAARDHLPVAQGRAGPDRADRPGPGVVLAHPGRDARGRAAVPGPPPPAGPPGPHPRRPGRPPGPAKPASEFTHGAAWWRSERRLRSAAGTTIGHCRTPRCTGPTNPPAPIPGQVWAVEAELTPKGAIRTTAIMTTLLARTTGPHPAYDHVVYLCAPPALPGVRRAAAALGAGDRVEVHGLPEGALL